MYQFQVAFLTFIAKRNCHLVKGGWNLVEVRPAKYENLLGGIEIGKGSGNCDRWPANMPYEVELL